MLVPRPAVAASFLRAVKIQISQEHKPKYSIRAALHAPRRLKALRARLLLPPSNIGYVRRAPRTEPVRVSILQYGLFIISYSFSPANPHAVIPI